ncbi:MULTISPECIES: serine protease [Staphylococcus]|uniref:Serine protease n=1 Tax=Staphylococcus pettenkoferi TaxID=170573 RepID=A0A2N6QBB9_9STAP|nr:MULTISPECIES: serine protease [Staphylococcus]MBX8994500.1 trypsin-like peptidase domain-containing protein [Staphylococcus pettenkoferi]MCI2792505.1 serine protease [Staphylococcus pettenkoferi]MCY1567573.1 serine protease [Staphylococcus pettenkoferi]MCY1587271.1 serine protease [Staphylococcus pettenkoferi]MCY1605076.1 serine protease [Staphylococcus pettenkoferi]
MKNVIKKTSAALIATGLLTVELGAEMNTSQAVEGHYDYDGMYPSNANSAYQKATNINNNDVTIKHYGYANKTKYKAVGRVSNVDGWKGKGKDSMGTGFMIDKHTFLTNGHVIDNPNGKAVAAKNVTFEMNRDGNKRPYKFHANRISKVAGQDIAVVNTKEDMSKAAQPLKLATQKQIQGLKYKDRLYSLGYPWQNNDNTKAYWNKFRFLQYSSNHTELMFKDKFRAGASGSPIVNNKYQVYGLRTYGWNLRGNSTDKYSQQEVAGGEALTTQAQQFINNHRR